MDQRGNNYSYCDNLVTSINRRRDRRGGEVRKERRWEEQDNKGNVRMTFQLMQAYSAWCPAVRGEGEGGVRKERAVKMGQPSRKNGGKCILLKNTSHLQLQREWNPWRCNAHCANVSQWRTLKTPIFDFTLTSCAETWAYTLSCGEIALFLTLIFNSAPSISIHNQTKQATTGSSILLTP